MDSKFYRVIDPKDESDALGGEVSENNSHLTICMSRTAKNHRTLKIGESMMADFYCSGTSGTYRVLRTR